MDKLAILWRDHRLLFVAFSVALLVTVLLAARLTVMTVYWSRHRDTPIEGWMTIPYVARSFDVPKEQLAAALGVETGSRRGVPLSELAAQLGLSDAELEKRLLDAVDAARAASGAGEK